MPEPKSENCPAAWAAAARRAMETEAAAILCAAGRLDGNFSRAVEVILAEGNKVVVTGMGKSGHVAQKIAATLCGTGTPAVFMHPAEALHGGVGVYSPKDPTVLISKSGTTGELLRLIPVLRGFESTLIGIVGNVSSPLARGVDIVLDGSVGREADPHSLAPTASAVVALALGDALAVALMQARDFTCEDFGRYHPAGQLGRNLLVKVSEAMHSGVEVAWARCDDSLKEVVVAMTRYPLGAACVIDGEGRLAGLITDGDLRRALKAHDDIRPLRACDIMTPDPVRIGPSASLHQALRVMEDRPSQISVLPVVDENGVCAGLIRLHDIYRGAVK
ncbi:MAG: KpsF/GutQ family sugar-phosphate isomerase [Acidobacteria bacterium]|nr:KpsF/GutQ family sugar-phosphate isomerase [Acidobacteriota bacterium]